MNLTKLTTLTLIPLTLALSSGCSLLKKNSPPAPASAEATAAATPAPKPAKAPKAPVWQDVVIRSVPSGATVVIDGQPVGVTPLSASLDLARTYDLELKLSGYLINMQSLRAVSGGGGGVSLGKSGLAGYHPPAFPSQVRIPLALNKDSFKALENAIAMLDNQLKRQKITPAVYQQKVAEVTRFYSQGQ
jgi:hypothetical protein